MTEECQVGEKSRLQNQMCTSKSNKESNAESKIKCIKAKERNKNNCIKQLRIQWWNKKMWIFKSCFLNDMTQSFIAKY